MRNARLAAILAAAGLTLLAPAAPAVAGIWSPIASGTTSDITAVEDARADVLLYGTASGQLLKNGTVTGTFPGHSITDIALNSGGLLGLATASNGMLLRTTNGGDSWSTVTVPPTYNQPVPCLTAGPGTVPITSNLNGVTWSNDSTAYVVAADRGVVLKTVNGGATFTDASRQADGSCRVDTNGDILTDVAAVPGSDVVWFADDAFGATSITTNGLASSAPRRSSASAVNCFDHHPQLALDTNNPNRAFMVDRCDGALQLGTTTDGGTDWELSHHYFAGNPDELRGLNDVAIARGSALAVGNGGAILIANDSRDVYFQRADGALATTDWLSVSKRADSHAVVGGTGGALIQTATAERIPDIVAPVGTVLKPAVVTAGTPATFTTVVGDNPGGSGMDLAGWVWSASGQPTTTGTPVGGVQSQATFTFPAPGSYTVSVAFKDLAGNSGTASVGVNVGAPPSAGPVTVPPKPKGPKTVVAAVPGAKITLGVPATCVAAGKTFKVTLTWKKVKRKGNRFVKVRRADFYIGTKRVKIDTKAPFTQTLKVKAGSKSGSSVTVRARAYIKVSKGKKSPTKSIKTTVKVC